LPAVPNKKAWGLQLKVKYRVHYPVLQEGYCRDHHRDFLTRAEAEKFARDRQKILDLGPAHFDVHLWRTIRIQEIE
jgi:hypothetical protein